MKFYEALALIGGYQISVFLIINFVLNAFRERMYLTSMLKHLYQYDIPIEESTQNERDFDIRAFTKIDPSSKKSINRMTHMQSRDLLGANGERKKVHPLRIQKTHEVNSKNFES
jgi:hypothetical protein